MSRSLPLLASTVKTATHRIGRSAAVLFFLCVSACAPSPNSENAARDAAGSGTTLQVPPGMDKTTTGAADREPDAGRVGTGREVSTATVRRPDHRPARDSDAFAESWPRFRGPSGQGRSDGSGLPVQWSQDQGVVWKTPLPGAGASSPIVHGDRIYLTCYSGYLVPGQAVGSLDKLERHLLAVDLATGEVLWERTVAARQPEEERIRDHGYAANSPLADDDHVYVFFGKSGVLAYDHHGNQVWQADVGTGTGGWGTAASPVAYGDLIWVNASVESESLVALERHSGREVHRIGGMRESWSTPLIVQDSDGQDTLVVPRFGEIMAIDPQSADTLWTCRTDITWYMVPSLVMEDGVVLALGGRSGISSLAVRGGGRGDVTDSHRLWTSVKGSNVSSPVAWNGHLYFMNDAMGIAYCARVDDGELMYEERIPRAGQVYASALLADGKIYYVSRDGQTFVLAAEPEYKLLASNSLRDGGSFDASPAVAGNRLLIRSDKYLYCIGE